MAAKRAGMCDTCTTPPPPPTRTLPPAPRRLRATCLPHVPLIHRPSHPVSKPRAAPDACSRSEEVSLSAGLSALPGTATRTGELRNPCIPSAVGRVLRRALCCRDVAVASCTPVCHLSVIRVSPVFHPSVTRPRSPCACLLWWAGCQLGKL